MAFTGLVCDGACAVLGVRSGPRQCAGFSRMLGRRPWPFQRRSVREGVVCVRSLCWLRVVKQWTETKGKRS